MIPIQNCIPVGYTSCYCKCKLHAAVYWRDVSLHCLHALLSYTYWLACVCRECQTDDESRSDSCRSMCCGRGYTSRQVQVHYRCECKYYWCCYVKCKTCSKVVQVNRCRWLSPTLSSWNWLMVSDLRLTQDFSDVVVKFVALHCISQSGLRASVIFTRLFQRLREHWLFWGIFVKYLVGTYITRSKDRS